MQLRQNCDKQEESDCEPKLRSSSQQQKQRLLIIITALKTGRESGKANVRLPFRPKVGRSKFLPSVKVRIGGKLSQVEKNHLVEEAVLLLLGWRINF